MVSEKTRNFTGDVRLIHFFDISFNTARKDLKIAQIAQLNQFFQLLHLAHIYGHCFYSVSRMLMSKNVNNDVNKDSSIRRRAINMIIVSKELFAFPSSYYDFRYFTNLIPVKHDVAHRKQIISFPE